ncbi:MAG: hypothetical protein R3E01_14960 [Pirellulaceae bacterium]
MRSINDYDAVIRYIETSDLPRKPNKLEGVSIARAKGIPVSLADDPAHGEPFILVDGIAIDPSELETGHWL